MSINITDPLEEDHFYHIFNRAIDGNQLFYQERNFTFFLWKLNEYLSAFIDLYSYCLLPNHFHLLCYTKSIEINGESISQAFRRLFISYSMAINKQEERMGSLFMKPFKRKKIDDDDYLATVMSYIHLNPLKHELSTSFSDYKWSSYNDILWGNKILKCKEVIQLFGSRDEYINHHKIQSQLFKVIHRDAIFI
ncbi:transposase [Bacteroidota bacterium]